MNCIDTVIDIKIPNSRSFPNFAGAQMSEAIIVALIALFGVIVQAVAAPLLKAYLPRRAKKREAPEETKEEDGGQELLIEPSEIDIFKSKLFFLAGCGDIVIGLAFYLMINAGIDGGFFITILFCVIYLAVSIIPGYYYYAVFANYGRYFAILASVVVPLYFVACWILMMRKAELPQIYAIGFYVLLFLHYLAVRADLLWFRVRHPEEWRSVTKQLKSKTTT
jgi:hypothetical protein